MKTHFATSNPGKFKEAKMLFNKNNLELEHYNVDLLEIQTDNVEELALYSVRHAFKALNKPVFVEDAGIFIKSLKDFPGVYSKHACYTIGLEGILKLLEGVEDRSAEFRAVVAYKDAENEKVFKGVCRGNITSQVRGRDGFGYDPIFLPQGKNKTYAEDLITKTDLSHRAQALKQLVDYLKLQA
jgi:XTP/dITP diphosphohydrolase|tara:strand:+ start:1075 stop:1626 length:552 start_codon:yes stop_codon:yes gene_type:complete